MLQLGTLVATLEKLAKHPKMQTATQKRKPPLKGPHWTKEEREKLEELIGDYTFPLVEEKYIKWAEENGYPKRGGSAIRHKIYNMGESTVPIGNWIRMTDIARMLGLGSTTVRYWVNHKMLPARKITESLKSPLYIKRSDFVAFAEKHPELLAGCSFEQLMAVLEKEDLARHISENYKVRCKTKTRVRCVETRKVYECVRDAANAHFVSTMRITHAVKYGGTSAGYHWEAVR